MDLGGFFVMDRIIAFLKTVEDKRDSWKVRHSLVDIILLVFFARLSGAEYWEDIEDFGKYYESNLRTVLLLENGIPSHDTIQRVFATLNPNVLVTMTKLWADLVVDAQLNQENFTSFSKQLIAIDGKTMRGNASAKQSPLHVVSAYATETGICFGQIPTQEKSNEITAIPELLDSLSLKGCLITIDAMGTQKKIAEKIIQSGGDFCLSVKENQKGLLEDIVDCFLYDKEAIVDSYESIEKAHGQIETRTYEVVHDTEWFRKNHKEWPHIQSLGKASCVIEKDNKQTKVERYFILSCQVSADELSSYVRGHWKIESMHWLLDVVFREDANKTLNKQLAFNLNIIDKFCLSVLRNLDVGKKMSMRRKKFHLSMGFEKYLKNLI